MEAIQDHHEPPRLKADVDSLKRELERTHRSESLVLSPMY
jgi:hypothetical protein